MNIALVRKGTAFLDQGKPVTVKGDYWLATHEVTQQQWGALMGTNPSYFGQCGPQCPVENVSVNDALMFIDQLNRRINGKAFRLPTEQEWLYAAVSHVKSDLYVTSEQGRELVNSRYAWLSNSSDLKTHPVGKLESTGYQIHDLLGNVREGVLQDCTLYRPWWQSIYQLMVGNDCSQRVNEAYITLGGSWIDEPSLSRPAVRYHEVRERAYDVGFRLALPADSRSAPPK
ncbi:MAG: formylglycine-generating enzyme family protein [Giesbergeria sp.]